jgi:hypothetical protein
MIWRILGKEAPLSLVVARILGDRISIASDTQVSEHCMALPFKDSVIKSCILPGGLCVSFTNSPELAIRELSHFVEMFPHGTGFAEVVGFFESSSARTGNEYILAFASPAKLVKITEGKAVRGLAEHNGLVTNPPMSGSESTRPGQGRSARLGVP